MILFFVNNPINILAITYWSYRDALIQTATLPHLWIIQRRLPPGSKIYLVTLEKKDLGFLSIERNQVKLDLSARGIEWISFHYAPFGWNAFLIWTGALFSLGYCIFRNKINFIHCWGTPAGVVGYLLSILSGRKLVIDSYEPHAEAMVENGTWAKSGLAFRLLFWFEKIQTRHAHSIIATTEGVRQYAKLKYGLDINRFFVKPACVDLQLFSEKNIKNPELLERYGFVNKIVCVYAGKFGGIYLEHEVFDFLKVATTHWGDSFRVLLLSNHPPDAIREYCARTGMDPAILTQIFVKHSDIPDYLGLGDFAITPVKPVPTKQYCTPIKDGEYWALGLPVVIPANISDDSRIIFENDCGAVLDGLDTKAYEKAVDQISLLISKPRAERFNKIRALAKKFRSFDIAERVYREVYPAMPQD